MTILQETVAALDEARLPDPPGLFSHEGVQVHEADIDDHPHLLVFGHIPFEQMIRIAQRYGKEAGEIDDAEFYDFDKTEWMMVEGVLAHLAYDHVCFIGNPPATAEPEESEFEGFTVKRGEGLIPVTLWEL